VIVDLQLLATLGAILCVVKADLKLLVAVGAILCILYIFVGAPWWVGLGGVLIIAVSIWGLAA
jgi:hypothetical protein